MDTEPGRKVLAASDVREVSVIDGGDTLAIHFIAADTSDGFVLVPLRSVGPLIEQLKAAEIQALALQSTGRTSSIETEQARP